MRLTDAFAFIVCAACQFTKNYARMILTIIKPLQTILRRFSHNRRITEFFRLKPTAKIISKQGGLLFFGRKTTAQRATGKNRLTASCVTLIFTAAPTSPNI
jgi:hypothetical protein